MVVLSPGRFNALIGLASQQVQWKKASLCPCRDVYSGAAKTSCPTCDGIGTLWAAPVGAWCVPAGMKVQRQWQQFGQFEAGDIVVTVGSDSPLYQAGESDRILLVESTEPFEKILTYTGTESLRYPVAGVTSAFWLDPTTSAQVTAGIPVVGSTGIIDWSAVTGGQAPPAGIQYSLSGRRIPEFFIFQNLPGDRAHFGGSALPRRMLFRKFDLFGKA